MQILKSLFSLTIWPIICISTSGCVATSIIENEDVAIPANELASIDQGAPAFAYCLASIQDADRACRNAYVTRKMFEIDQNFASYKLLISRGGAIESFSADVTQIGLAAAGAVIPVSQTTKVLTAASAAVGLSNTALNKDLLLSQTMQVIEQEMSTLRASVKQTILARLAACPASQYPYGLILSDLQAYADAGTVTGALNGIQKATANSKPTTNGGTGTASPTTTSTSPNSVPTTNSNGYTVKTGSAGVSCPLSPQNAVAPALKKAAL